jgi:sigma-B regulation protein RsbU (phosphoserine phosphatase)
MPLIITPDAKSPQRIECTPGFPLGVQPDCAFPTTEHVLEAPRGMFLMYTDGVIEARNPDGAEFGEDALHAALVSDETLDPQSVVDNVRRAVAQFASGAPQSDDITILAARIG